MKLSRSFFEKDHVMKAVTDARFNDWADCQDILCPLERIIELLPKAMEADDADRNEIDHRLAQ